MDCVEIDKCRLCGGKIETVLDLGKTPIANNYLTKEELGTKEPYFPLILVKCNCCGCVQLKHDVNPELLFKNYSYVSGTTASFRRHFVDYALDVMYKSCLRADDLVVSIGSNDYTDLRYFKKAKMRTVGVEPATNLAKKCNENGDITINEFFTPEVAKTIIDKHGHAKVIVCNNCYAHSPNLNNITMGVVDLLDKDGYFIFEVAYLGDMLQQKAFEQAYFEHYFYHGVKPIQKFLQKYDLAIVDIERINTHGGSIRVWCKRAYGQFINYTTVRLILEEEEKLRMYEDETWSDFSAEIAKRKEALNKKLQSIKKKGGRIAVYGIPAKFCTFSHFLGLDNKIIDFAVDDSPLKQNKFTPVNHIPIFPREKLIEEQPEYCIVSPYNFYNVIVENNKDYKGTWINPIVL